MATLRGTVLNICASFSCSSTIADGRRLPVKQQRSVRQLGERKEWCGGHRKRNTTKEGRYELKLHRQLAEARIGTRRRPFSATSTTSAPSCGRVALLFEANVLWPTSFYCYLLFSPNITFTASQHTYSYFKFVTRMFNM